MGKRFTEQSLQVEKFQYRLHLSLYAVLMIFFFAATWYLAGRGLSSRVLPLPEGYSAVLVAGASPRNQASVWLTTPEGSPQVLDPDQDVVLQFYASFETVDPGHNPPDRSSRQMLETYQISYVLVDRLARNLVSCDGASVSQSLGLADLQPGQFQMAAQVLPIPGLVEPGPEAPLPNLSPTTDWVFVILRPSAARSDGWVSPNGHQPTAVMEFTCKFRSEAFWRVGEGAVLFAIPGLYSNYRDGGDSSTGFVQRLTRRIVLARADPAQSGFKFSDSDTVPSYDDNRNARYETPEHSGGVTMDWPSSRVWYLDQAFDDRQAWDVFLAGASVGIAATALVQVLDVGLSGLIDKYFAERRSRSK